MNTEHSHGVGRSHAHPNAAPGHTHDTEPVGTARDREVVERREVAPAAVEVGPTAGGLTGRFILTILGAAGMIIGAFLDWSGGAQGIDVEFTVFYSTEVGTESGLVASAGFAFVVLGLLAVLGMAFRTGWLTRLAGALGLVAAILLVVSVYRADGTIGDLALGFWLVAIGSLVALIGGFLGSRPRVVATSVPV
jgi:hypothetical protein